MPVIHAKDSKVIAWSGITAGPIQEHELSGMKESPWVRYEAEVGIGNPDTAKVVVRVQKSWRAKVLVNALSIEGTERQIVTQFIEERVTGDYQPLDAGTTNNFDIPEDRMLERYKK